MMDTIVLAILIIACNSARSGVIFTVFLATLVVAGDAA